MLTPYEIDLLRRSKTEMARLAHGVLANRQRHIAELESRVCATVSPMVRRRRPCVRSLRAGRDTIDLQKHDSTDICATRSSIRASLFSVSRTSRYPCPSTLKLTAALRGLLMGACPEQPPPEWFSGHRAERHAHFRTLIWHWIPLPFVGSQHADGRIMGLALVLPRGVDPIGGWTLP